MQTSVLPWQAGCKPLMLAPMQGLTNAALRQCFLEHYQPDHVFTEFVRVQTQSRKRITKGDLAEAHEHTHAIPLIVQLIGNNALALAQAAEKIQAAGCRHINLNLGCPYGRMTSGATGGELLKEPQQLESLLLALRHSCRDSFSVKWRAGYDNPEQWRELLPLFEGCGVDFLILHPRTVTQRYNGVADHEITAKVVAQTTLPVIANGDITDAIMARRLLKQTGAAGLMLGRGALADPGLFRRIRGDKPEQITVSQRRQELGQFITDLLPRYLAKFCGERQALMKIKDVLNFMAEPELQRDLAKIKRSTSSAQFIDLLQRFSMTQS